MKLLYAIQGTGNGHIARAQEIIPILKKHALVDVLISGHQSQLKPSLEIDYQFSGLSLLYNDHGGLSYKKTFLENSFCKAFKVIQSLDLKEYDLIINDFEPLTAWTAKLKNLPIMALSHQAALSFAGVPKPKHKNILGENILKYYAPCKKKIGFHFKSYHPNIKTPVIRKEIRELDAQLQDFFLVYLPSFSDEILIKTLGSIDVPWKVFSKYSTYYRKINNVEIFPIDQKFFLQNFAACKGILCNAGFEAPAEALYLNKKLFVIPIQNQYEQLCNATALQEIGVSVSYDLNIDLIKNWINEKETLNINYPDNIEETLIKEVLSFR